MHHVKRIAFVGDGEELVEFLRELWKDSRHFPVYQFDNFDQLRQALQVKPFWSISCPTGVPLELLQEMDSTPAIRPEYLLFRFGTPGEIGEHARSFLSDLEV